MIKKDDFEKRLYAGRSIDLSDRVDTLSKPKDTGDDEFDLIKLLRGIWVSQAQGWNLIALPASPLDLEFTPATPTNNFRLLMNQYGETLKFDMPDLNVPNRGIIPDAYNEPDQLVDGITYEQFIVQKAVADFPQGIDNGKRRVRAANGEPIHHEPGFFLQFLNHIHKGTSPDVTENGKMVEKELKIARMGTIPHGNSVLAMGYVTHDKTIESSDAFPERLRADKDGKEIKIELQDVKSTPYLAPYQNFIDKPFFGCVDPKLVPGFPGFSPDNTSAILQFTQKGLKIKKTTVLNFDTKFKVSGIDDAEFDQNEKPIAGFPISNISFIKREANVTEMHATFWVMELENDDPCADPEFVMQYSQTVYLEFFYSPVDKDAEGRPRRIRWPHVSINTLRKVSP